MHMMQEANGTLSETGSLLVVLRDHIENGCLVLSLLSRTAYDTGHFGE